MPAPAYASSTTFISFSKEKEILVTMVKTLICHLTLHKKNKTKLFTKKLPN